MQLLYEMKNSEIPIREIPETGFETVFGESAFRSTMCREIVCSYLETTTELRTVGIMCAGDSYAQVSQILEKKPKNTKLLSEFIKTLTGANFRFELGRLPKEACKRMGFPESVEIVKGKSVDMSKSIWVIFDALEIRNAILVSAILGILRESFLMSGIVNGKIKTPEQFFEALVDISALRYFEKDSGLDCHSIYTSNPGNHRNKERLISEVRRILSEDGFNSTGTDWASLFLLGCYLKKFSLSKKANRRNKFFGDSNGPVSEFLSEPDPKIIRYMTDLLKFPALRLVFIVEIYSRECIDEFGKIYRAYKKEFFK